MNKLFALALVAVIAGFAPFYNFQADWIGDVKLSNNIFIGLSQVIDAQDGTSTWIYRVREHPHSGDLKWWLLEVKDCVSVVNFPGGEWVDTGTIKGVRWTVPASFDSGTFSLIVQTYPVNIAVTAEAEADATASAQIDGPGCVPVTTPTASPTATFTPTVTSTATATALPTATLEPSATPGPTATLSPNQNPFAADGQVTTYQGQAISINVLALVTDPDGDTPLLTGFEAISEQSGHVTRLDNSTPNDLSDDRLRYTPPSGFTGMDHFQYTASDGVLSDSGVMTVVVQPPVNDPVPVGQPDQYTVAAGPITVSAPGVLANDDPAGLAVTAVLERGVTNGSIILNSSGAFTYTPPAGFYGQNSFSYRLVSGSIRSLPVEVTLVLEDDVSPTVTWVWPVSAGQRYDLSPSSNVLMHVNVSDNTTSLVVSFTRWDALNNRYVDLGTVTSDPYQLSVPASTFNDGWNQVNAEAVDLAGNVSDSPYIWIYRANTAPEVTHHQIFLPVTRH